jgi:hypothetical protein
MNEKIRHGLRRPPKDGHIHNNQPKTPERNGGHIGKDVQPAETTVGALPHGIIEPPPHTYTHPIFHLRYTCTHPPRPLLSPNTISPSSGGAREMSCNKDSSFSFGGRCVHAREGGEALAYIVGSRDVSSAGRLMVRE